MLLKCFHSGDVHKLYKDHKVNVRNCVDLSLLARSADNPRWKGKYNSSIGLSRLIEEYEDETLQKGKITRSNWEAILSTAQQSCQLFYSRHRFVLHHNHDLCFT